MKRKTFEEIYNLFKEKGYELLETEYKNAHVPMLYKTKEGYKAKISYCALKNIKNEITLNTFFRYNNEYAIENLKLYLKINTQCKLNEMEEFKFNSNEKIPLICKCGKKFYPLFGSVLRNNNIMCENCTNEYRHNINILDEKDIRNKLNKLGYVLIGHYNSHHDSIEVFDNNEGYFGFANYKNLLNGTKLKPFILPLNAKHFLYNLKLYAKKNNSNVEIIDYEYIKNKNRSVRNTKIKCICSCGNKFYISYGSFMKSKGNVYCEECNKKISMPERKTLNLLEEKNINFIRQYRFDDCRNIFPLPFDFYLPEYNCCIECDGEQHDRERSQFIRTDEQFKLIELRDNIKTNYCNKKGIKLIRIKYKDFRNNNYKKIILDNIFD